ncbi:hypothetical protein AVEN_211880-1 [Araneus ventricosus]|uniref:Uncharacterized protein n=1 Tax=Araneus ventricosus TaxID=182803 RepID=A0A4Y2EYJ6_ARAVE|nr:hypothetical protein AVEN_211880-1 [Araneus ventricosus]
MAIASGAPPRSFRRLINEKKSKTLDGFQRSRSGYKTRANMLVLLNLNALLDHSIVGVMKHSAAVKPLPHCMTSPQRESTSLDESFQVLRDF